MKTFACFDASNTSLTCDMKYAMNSHDDKRYRFNLLRGNLMNSSVQKFGAHATSFSRASKIFAKKKFYPSTKGMRGPGVYFWEKTAVSDRLCLLWYRQQFSAGKYGADSDKGCSVVDAVLSCHKDEYLNLDDEHVNMKLMEWTKQIESNEKMSTKLQSGIFIRFYQDIERHNGGKKFKLVRARVSAPYDPDKIYPRWSGLPVCYIVRDTDVIMITGLRQVICEADYVNI